MVEIFIMGSKMFKILDSFHLKEFLEFDSESWVLINLYLVTKLTIQKGSKRWVSTFKSISKEGPLMVRREKKHREKLSCKLPIEFGSLVNVMWT